MTSPYPVRSDPLPADDPVRPYDLVIFDCDGVLVDSEVLSCQCLMDLLRGCGHAVDLDEVFGRFLGRSLGAVTAHYQAQGKTLPPDFRSRLRAGIRQSFAAALKPTPEVGVLLRGLEMDYCLASSSDLERIEFSLTVTGLRPLFEGRIFSADFVARGKPAPDLFLHAAAQMGVAPARSLVIEDSISGVQAAKAAGMAVCGFVGGSHYQSPDRRAALSAAGPLRIFERMTDLAAFLGEQADGRVRQ